MLAAIPFAVVATVVVVLLAFPEPKQPNLAATGKPGSARVAPPVNVHVSAATRRAIDRILDRFIPAGVGRRSMTTAWRLAGPELKAASTLAQWRRDTSPLPYYPVGGTTFHDWTTLDAGRNYVDLSILLRPRRGSHLGDWGFSGQMIRRGSHWLVNRFYTAATFDQTGHRVGPSIVPGQDGTAVALHPALSQKWLIVPIAGVLGLLVLLPLGFFLVSALGDRRLRRRHADRNLPPLPANVALRTWSGRRGRT